MSSKGPIDIRPAVERAKSSSPPRPGGGIEPQLYRFSDVAIGAADWFWEMDAGLRFTYLSGAFETTTGRPQSKIIGQTIADALGSVVVDDADWVRANSALKAADPFAVSLTLTEDAGRVLRFCGRPALDETGGFLGYRGVGFDISESAAARRQLRDSEHRFRTIIDNVSDIVCIVDRDNQMRFLNRAVSRVLGYTVEELGSGSAGEHALPEDQAKIKRAMQQARDYPGRIIAGTYRFRHKDGSIRTLHVNRKCLGGADGDGSVIVHARDITAQQAIELALRQSEERLRDFAETGADWFWEQDAEMRYTYLSGKYPDHEHTPVEQILGRTREEISPGSNFKAENWRQLYARLAAHEPFSNFEYAFPRHDGSELMVRVSGKPKFDDNGRFAGYRGTGIDITESHLLSQQLNYQASHDPLTGLVNRREFELRLARVIKSCREDDGEHALCYIDLDQFKVVNDTCGHDAGDELLRQISALLKDIVRKRDTIARLGGDEFGLLLERCSIEQANRVAENVRDGIDKFRFIWAGRNFRLGASIGVIPIDFTSGNIANVMRSADAACYAAKDAGRNRIHVYSADNFELAQRHQEMQRIVDITHAFDEERFVLYHQKIHTLNPELQQKGDFSEVLVRMIDEDGFPVLPELFMPAAERYNLVTQLDSWVVRNSLDWLQRNPDMRLTVNLSGMSIADEKFLDFVTREIESHGTEPGRVCFEITETAAIANLSRATYFIDTMRERGCFFALDDFGSGLSSFAYLKTLPVDFLKIDGFFVRDMVDDRINFELVKSINDIGHVMGKRTIAEFVETDECLEAVRDIGVDYSQGYGIARPTPLDDE